MNILKPAAVVSLLLLQACDGQGIEIGDINGFDYTIVDGVPLKTCISNDGYIYSPDDSAYLAGCQLVKGLVYIQPHGDKTSLENFHLNEIVRIDGDLHIADSTSLTSLDGFDELTTLNGRLFILYNEQLEDMSAFHNLSHVGDAVLINHNPMLKAITLPALSSEVHEMQIVGNDSAEAVVFESMKEFGSIGISGNQMLSRVAFASLERGQTLTVTANFQLAELDFPALTEVDVVHANTNAEGADYSDLAPFMD